MRYAEHRELRNFQGFCAFSLTDSRLIHESQFFIGYHLLKLDIKGLTNTKGSLHNKISILLSGLQCF
ncbi:hypothetical protein Krac_11640 [Ktedonobacter racemifer DSM 44963]|uniref:Uncharacterized protein n=1 Tax=Ktedonobacter racemifer DSM 44963 TaxID=485913 RepID=D6TCZ2_KTERA|nr:hypothetical protein Krac_11640 [Ktedonobacter racemifer DSM 44963]